MSIRMYAAWGSTLVMHREPGTPRSMAKAREFASRLSLTHPAAEIRELTAQGTEHLLDTYIAGRSIAE